MSVRLIKTVLWALVGAALVALAARFINGLGATTNLNDVTPWGLWIGLKLAGVAFAAGGFTIAAVVYIFQREPYHILARRAVLLGLLGYTFFVVSLIVDLGIPWNIWRPVFFWNIHSPLFEVAWCVMLYLTVLLLEFAPVVLEKYRERWRLCDLAFRFLRRVTIPLVIFGIALSVLHQSSLGTLFAIMPHRQHPLFYSPIVNVLFFVSCVAMGLAAVIFEAHIAHALYRRRVDDALMARLGRYLSWIVWLYAIIRFADLAIRGDAPFLVMADWNTALFWFEMLPLLLLPSILIQWRRVRASRALLGTMAFLVVVGFSLNRITVAGLATVSPTHTNYFPSGLELLMSFGLVPGIAVLIWMFLVENYEVFEPEQDLDRTPSPTARPQFDRASGVWLGDSTLAGFRRYSLAFIVAAAVAFGLLPDRALFGSEAVSAPVQRPRGRDVLLVDGDRAGFEVAFKHQAHIDRNGANDSCVLCHHMVIPRDRDTPCWACHRDMWSATDIFDHDGHAETLEKAGAADSCAACHQDPDQPKDASGTPACDAEGCHRNQLAMHQAGARITPEDPARSRLAVGYMDAMHELCIRCHQEKAEALNRPNHWRCATCHGAAPTRNGP
jgi:Ni/Fe-hydrogenase subunit HybB-like protein